MEMRSVALAMAMMVVSGSVLEGAGAQEDVTCGKVQEDDAPISDANTLVQAMRLNTGQCCPTNDHCNVLLKCGNAEAVSCRLPSCMSCADVGNSLNEVLAQCNDANGVQGLYFPDGAYGGTVLLTAASTQF